MRLRTRYILTVLAVGLLLTGALAIVNIAGEGHSREYVLGVGVVLSLLAAWLTFSLATGADPTIRFDTELVTDPGGPGRLTLLVTMEIEEGWHLYAEVPEGESFQATELHLDLPASIETEGGWKGAA